ncbi:hypothetical protein SUGI_0534090 [Cryptomeria japonica]|nr:hypothetical protein SUGI_0534090 [Cryptomeria japonica]
MTEDSLSSDLSINESLSNVDEEDEKKNDGNEANPRDSDVDITGSSSDDILKDDSLFSDFSMNESLSNGDEQERDQ